MAAAFRSLTSTTYASRTNTVGTAPAGLTDGDIIVASLLLGASTSAPTATPPAGFNQPVGSPTNRSDSGGFNGKLFKFWKRASGESGSYTFTHTSASSQLILEAYSGAAATGDPIDVLSVNSGTGDITTATGITTTANDELLIWHSHDWTGGGTLSPPSGFTTQFTGSGNLLFSARSVQALAGASGNKTQTNGNNSAGVWGVFLLALKSAGASSISASASQTLAVGQSAAATGLVKGAAAQTIAVSQGATAAAIVKASASQTIELGQSASGQMVLVKAQASQTIAIGQSVVAAARVAASAAQSIAVGQSATAVAIIAASSTLAIPVSQVATGAQPIAASAAQAISVGQVAVGNVGAPAPISASASQQIGVGQAAVSAARLVASASQVVAVSQSATGSVPVTASAASTIPVQQSAAAKLLVSASAGQSIEIAQVAAAIVTPATLQASQTIPMGQTASLAVVVQAVAASQIVVSQQAVAQQVIIPTPATRSFRVLPETRRVEAAHKPRTIRLQPNNRTISARG